VRSPFRILRRGDCSGSRHACGRRRENRPDTGDDALRPGGEPLGGRWGRCGWRKGRGLAPAAGCPALTGPGGVFPGRDRARARRRVHDPEAAARRAVGQRPRVRLMGAAAAGASRAPRLGAPAAEPVVALVGQLVGLGLGPGRPPDQVEGSGNRDLQDHAEEEDRPEPLHAPQSSERSARLEAGLHPGHQGIDVPLLEPPPRVDLDEQRGRLAALCP
jgi:hypothetical protein